MPSLLPYVLSLIAAQVSLNALVVAFTAPSSPLRLALLPLILTCVHQVLPLCFEATCRVIWAALLGAHSVSFLFQYVDTALLSRWSAEAGGATAGRTITTKTVSHQHGPKTMWARLRWGYYAAVSTRNLGTPFEVSGVPRFSEEDPSYVPDRTTFLRRKALLLVSCYFVLDLTTLASQPEQNPILYNTSRISWANPDNRTAEQLIIRSASTLGFWISLYFIIQAYMGSVAFLSVAFGLSKVESWRPGFGPVSEAYSVRRFWGIFWHKYQQQKMSSPASFTTDTILHIPKGTLPSRYTHLFLTFFLSGLIHALTDIASGFTWQESGSIRFFCTQALGIMAEDGLQALVRGSLPDRKVPARYQSVVKVLGYVWVFAFLVWSTPVWIYPSLYANRGEEKDLIVPYSVLGVVWGIVKTYRT